MIYFQEPNRIERAAMWLFSADYAESGLSAVDFFARLSPDKQRLVREMVSEIISAPEKTRQQAVIVRLAEVAANNGKRRKVSK